jgi:hypothetical protein
MATHSIFKNRKHSNDITQAYLHSVIDYNPDTGIFTWKRREEFHQRIKTWNTRFAGKTTGNIRENGYVVVTINCIGYLAHRLAWFYVYGVWPPEHIDHKDTVKNNNKIDNLREATPSQNKQNRGAQKNNTSGYKGVFVYIKGNHVRYLANIKVNGEMIRLGGYLTAEKAYAAYCKAEKRYFGEFTRTK